MGTSSISGVVLAGGKSQRFGSDKRLAVSNDKILIAGACENISSAIGEKGAIGISTSAEENPAAFLESVLEPALRAVELDAGKFKIIPDVYPDSGPLGGILSSLIALDSEWILVLAVDLPRVSVRTLKRFIECATGSSDSRISAVTATGESGEMHPLIGCYNQSLRPYITRAVSAHNLGMRRFLDSIELLPEAGRIVKLAVSEDELHNVNYAGDISNGSDPA